MKTKYFITDNLYSRLQKTLRWTNTDMMKKSCVHGSQGKGTTDKEGVGSCLSLYKHRSQLWPWAMAGQGILCWEDRRHGRCSKWKEEVKQIPRDH